MDETTVRVRVEFVGLPSPYADKVVQWRIARGEIRPNDLAAIRRLEDERQNNGHARWPGVTERFFGPEHGFKESYHFGPESEAFIQAMDPEDARRLLDNAIDRHLYREVDAIILATG
jgi:hypothetical protein